MVLRYMRSVSAARHVVTVQIAPAQGSSVLSTSRAHVLLTRRWTVTKPRISVDGTLSLPCLLLTVLGCRCQKPVTVSWVELGEPGLGLL